MTSSVALSDRVGVLASVDWDFPNSEREPIHSLHPYPAKFIPEIPRELIRAYPPAKGFAVLDPFCGSGTTLVEAQRAGKLAIGVDVNPLATLISKVKTTPLPISIRSIAEDVVQLANQSPRPIPEIPRLDHWFQKDVQRALASLVAAIDVQDDSRVRDALRVALSRIIVRVSNQDSDTRYAAVKKDVDAALTFRAFIHASAVVDKALHAGVAGLNRDGQSRVINANLLDLQPDDLGRQVGLVVTSPPYPNAYEYWLYHKYRMYWLGMDPIAVRAAEIGARPHFFGRHPQTEDDFENQMTQCFALLSQVMVPESAACFLVGRSIIHGRVIDNESILKRSASRSGFAETAVIRRSIKASRKSFNPKHGNIKKESVMVFKFEA